MPASTATDVPPEDTRVEALLAQMTLEEKVGQLTQASGRHAATGPLNLAAADRDGLRSGRVGSMLNVLGARYTRGHQQEAMQSRLKIPLLFAHDVIHGYLTTFPVPLAEAASFDLVAIERSARVAATEAAAAGIHWTFAPMVDVTRDPRWGRVTEGAGEDPYLAAQIAAARVRGLQGRQRGDTDAVLATAKHFAGYGATVGGREYDAVDMSLRTLWETHLPPFKAARDAGAACFMNAFNDLNGVPATGHRHLLRDILKGAWGFDGVVVSDWASIGEMVHHGHAADLKDAAAKALNAGTDIDMESNAYRLHLPALVAEGRVSPALLDDAVRRVLRLKFELGLFDDPYRFSDPAREQALLGHPSHRQAAREMAARSIVLLKNGTRGGRPVLPLDPGLKAIAFIGPLVKAHQDHHGAWAVTLPEVDYEQFIVSPWQGLQQRLGATTQLLHAQGCDIDSPRTDGFAQAVAAAAQADLIIAGVGESAGMSGEARARSRIGLPGVQEDLLRALHATGKPLVVMISAGRPLIFNWTAEHADAVLYSWWLGSEAGHAMADVLTGAHNPAARLPMSFPRNEGQIPIYYSHFSTGRPRQATPQTPWAGGYIDVHESPAFAFGHGLSYTQFGYSDLRLDRTQMHGDEAITASVTLHNSGRVAGDEVVQWYLRDRVGAVVRPVMELKGFERVHLQPGERRDLHWRIGRETLAFFDAEARRVVEAGWFDVMVGASSADIRLRGSFQLVD
ncbi:MAG: beta-glucosidase BglX [Rubrivivax sp.]|nr:beta-glucosidase BglX [Rubrivivax sp.]